jgi:phospholipase C
MRFFLALALAPLALACSSSSGNGPPSNGDAGNPSDAGPGSDGFDGNTGVACSGPCPQSHVKYLVVIVQENHTFDNHFGRYCTAATGSNPSCTAGPSCCEAGPATDPSGASPITLNDQTMGGRDPNHFASCEGPEIDNGKMDQFVTGAACSDPGNFAYADTTLIKPYWDLADHGALADRYFQPLVGASSANDMYFARATWVFDDDQYEPTGAIGTTCTFNKNTQAYTGTTLADLLDGKGVPWTFYAGGYKATADAVAASACPSAPAACAEGLDVYPCTFDPADNPFDYYASSRDKIRDYGSLATDLAGGTLPAVRFVKAPGYISEHPGYSDRLSDGVTFVTQTVSAVLTSQYANDVLVLVTWDEGGGFFDHVSPPPASTVDNKPYGTRVPLMALGPFAKAGAISHETMEHSSIVKFVEWNWLSQTGQLGTRDTVVANSGSVLDSSKTGASVPEN